MSEHIKAEPCKKCGGESMIVCKCYLYYKVQCSFCDEPGPLKEKKQEAIEAWNRRTP